MPKPIIIGSLGTPFGVKGWLHLFSFTAPPENIFHYIKQWQIQKKDGALKSAEIETYKTHGNTFVVKLKNCNDRDQALLFKNHLIVVDRSAFPTPKKDEFYWADLVGLSVVNTQNELFGTIDYLFETGANDVIVTKGEQIHYIPYLKSVVLSVDVEKKIMIVEWEL